MVSSSKKKRGKQRKAAKKDKVQTQEAEDVIQFLPNSDGSFSVKEGHEKRIVHFVQVGRGQITAILANNDISNFSLQQSGVLSIVLFFLQRCEHESFDAVVNTTNNHNMDTPSTWIRLLLKSTDKEPDCMMQIIENIGPLVRCMCNDTKRMFFKSNKHWRESIGPFVALIYKTIHKCTIDSVDKKITHVLLQKNEGLLTSVVQWGFWELNRQDITKELSIVNNDLCKTLSELGRITTSNLITDTDNLGDGGLFTEPARKQLQIIGATPITSKDYDPNCMISYVSGLIRYMKTTELDVDLNFICYLIGSADCIDKGVITEMIDIDWGMNVADYESADFVMKMSSSMVQQWISIDNNKSEPSDTRFAFAIRAGLVEMCLNFIERFYEHEFFWEGEDSAICLYDRIKFLFEHMDKVSLYKKTSKAIRHKRFKIEEKLVGLKGYKSIRINTHWKELLDMVSSILNLNGSYCCRCNESLTRTEVKLCNGCGCMVYCSKSCQKEDWLNGHSVTCCKSYTNETAGQFQGRYQPDVPEDERAAVKLKELEINVNMIQLKLFLDNAENILTQTKELGIPIYDCVACFDLCECPPTVRVQDYKENFLTPEAVKGFEQSRSKENITCDFYAHIINGELDEDDDIPRLIMQRLFPHEWLTNEKKLGTRAIRDSATLELSPPNR